MRSFTDTNHIFSQSTKTNIYGSKRQSLENSSLDCLVPHNPERESAEGDISPKETRDRSSMSKSLANLTQKLTLSPKSRTTQKSFTEFFESPVKIITSLLSRMDNSIDYTIMLIMNQRSMKSYAKN